MTLDMAQLPFHLGGLGLRSAVRSSCAAHWASSAGSLPMIQKRDPTVARLTVAQLTDQSDVFHLSGATFSRERLLDVSCAVPDGLRPGQPLEDTEPGVPHHGWQLFASLAVDDCFSLHGVVRRLPDTQQAFVTSQCGPLAAIPFTNCFTSTLTRFDARAFRVLLLRRLWRPLPLSSSAGLVDDVLCWRAQRVGCAEKRGGHTERAGC